jgi:hypothetical protein
MGTSRQLPAQPLSIKELTRRAEDIEYDPSIPLKYWLRSADTLLKEVSYSCYKFARLTLRPRLESTKEKEMISKHTFSTFDMPLSS